MSGFFAMGGYGLYIWGAYGAAAAVLVGVWLASHRALKARQAELERAEAMSPRPRRG